MSDPLATYLQDHLAGARFALDLLKDLGDQTADCEIAAFAQRLHREVESDRKVLEDLTEGIGSQTDQVKELAAWVAQKAGRVKLSLNDPIGRFEAIEMLSLGVLGKLALWNALKTIQASDQRLTGLNLDNLTSRAIEQHAELEARRLKLAAEALTA